MLAEREGVVGLGIAVLRDDLDLGHAVGERERRLQRVGEPAGHVVLGDEPVDHHLDGVHLVALELEIAVLAEFDQVAVDDGASEALGVEVVEQRVVGALAAVHHRRQHLEPSARLELHDAVDDLLGCLPSDRCAVVGAVRHADAGVEEAQVVVDLGDGADRRARVARRRLLVDRDRR